MSGCEGDVNVVHEVDAPHADLVTMAIVDVDGGGDVNVVHDVDAPHADLVTMAIVDVDVDVGVEDVMVW